MSETLKNADKFTIGYKPDPFTRRDIILATLENEPDALQRQRNFRDNTTANAAR